jgi:hypothetical protein
MFFSSKLTEDARAQIIRRVAMHYPLMELSVGEVKSILKRALGNDATDNVIAKIYTVTSGIYGHIDMIIPRINELAGMNKQALSNGEMSMLDIVETAGRRLMVA